jgi:hypothetical protein
METDDISMIFSPLSKNNLWTTQKWKEYFRRCTEKREYYDIPPNNLQQRMWDFLPYKLQEKPNGKDVFRVCGSVHLQSLK